MSSSPRPPVFHPKLFTVLSEGYGGAELRKDAIAGLTVAIVALPLSMAIAIACGAAPEHGLVTAIIGGFLVSAFGGSRHQIGGPAGAFIVLVGMTLARHGPEGLALAIVLSGLMLVAMGALRLGTFVKYVPFPVTLGFTAAIGAIIAVAQLPDLLGLPRGTGDSGTIIARAQEIASGFGAFTPQSVIIAALTITTIFVMRKLAPRLPAFLFAIIVATAAATFLPGVETVSMRFGQLPGFLPMPHLPIMSLDAVVTVLPDAIAFALLGAIESLLSAVVADGMTGRRHRANTELIAQGIANIACAFFAGLPVTGTIARTATNVRSGAHGPVSGMLHALILLAFMAIAAPLAGLIPLAALAGILVVVAWNMIEQDAIKALFKASYAETLVFVVTLGLTLFSDLTEAIVVGTALSAFVIIHRLASLADLASHDEDTSALFDAQDRKTVIYKVSGAFFFGSTAIINRVLDRIGDPRERLILDLSAVPILDATGAHAIAEAAHKASRQNVSFAIAGAAREPVKVLRALIPDLKVYASIEEAVAVLTPPDAT